MTIVPVDVLEYSPLPAREFMKPILETTVEDLRGPLGGAAIRPEPQLGSSTNTEMSRCAARRSY
jgi:hypothetical protein